jgi:hypothetical protein
MLTAQSKAYFEQVHPVYPFLDRATFEQRAFGLTSVASSSSSSSSSPIDEVWSALYHTVLAIGCQYNDGGSFDPGNGQAWSLFERALSSFPNILMTKGSLVAVQVCAHFFSRLLSPKKKMLTNELPQALTAMVGSSSLPPSIL